MCLCFTKYSVYIRYDELIIIYIYIFIICFPKVHVKRQSISENSGKTLKICAYLKKVIKPLVPADTVYP